MKSIGKIAFTAVVVLALAMTMTACSSSSSSTPATTTATLASIAVTPAAPSIAVGSTKQFTATGTYSDNSTNNITASVTWSSSSPATATVSASGLATAAAAGTTTITATSGTISGSTTLTVSTSTTGTTSSTVQNVPATQQASTATQAANMGTGSVSLFQQVGLSQTVGAPMFRIGSKDVSSPFLQKAAQFSGKLAKIPAVSAAAAKLRARAFNAPTTGSTACTGGGTVDISLAGTTITMTFNACREDGNETTGTVNVSIGTSGTSVTYTEQMGTAANPLVMLAFSDNTYSVMTSKLSSAVTLVMSGTQSSANMSANGNMTITDYASGGDVYTTAFNQTTFAIAQTTSGSTVSSVTTLGGGISETWTPTGSTLHSATMTFNSFAVTDVYANSTAAAYDESISGGLTIALNPADCADGTGTFVFTTNTPVHYDANGIPQSGQMTISNTRSGTTTVVRVTYSGNGLITIEQQQTDGTFTAIQSDVDPYSLANLCGIVTPNEPAPLSTGATGTATTNASNAAFTATLSWDGLTSDMDFHLIHLASTATPTSTIYTYSLTSSGATANSDWHLYYGSGPGGGCASSENYVGTASAKVAVLDVDKCDGLGPEHITMDAPLPVGYYILYVNPYSMHSDAQTTVTVKLQIGSQLFSAPTHLFTSSSDADYRAFDIKVDTSGNVSVISPNNSFTVSAPAMRAPKY